MCKVLKFVLLVTLMFSLSAKLHAEGPRITAFSQAGAITWTCSSLNVTSRVEWAQSPAGPWQTIQSTWVTFPSNQLQTATGPSASGFFRVVYDTPDPHFADIEVEQSLALFCGCSDQPNFVILDVRKPDEYDTVHIVGAVNINYYPSATFQQRLNDLNLDKTKVYLVHCSLGGRSNAAHDIMLGLGFHEVYNMLGGMNAFQGLPGADAILIR